MTIDIEWFGLVGKYIKTGQRTDLEVLLKKIRENGVPERFGNEIADLLDGKLKPQVNDTTKEQREFYDKFLRYIKETKEMEKEFYKVYSYTIDAGIMANPFNSAKLNKKLLNKLFSIKFYQGNLESGRSIINKNIREGHWPKFK